MMTHTIEHSFSFPNDSDLLPKRDTSFSLQLPGRWMINQTSNKPLKSYKETSRLHDPSKPSTRWIISLLLECARAIAQKNPSKSHQLLWLLNELSSSYGDREERLSYYFLQALFARAHNSGLQCHDTLKLVAERNYCFTTHMKLILKFQEMSPWINFGHVASNSAILEALEGESNLHIIDLSNTLCTQWPTFIEALATRYDETPHLRLTLVVNTSLEQIIVKEVSQRMEKFARLMGVPFKLHVISGLDYFGELKKEDFKLQDDEAIVVNCIHALQRIQVEKRRVAIDMIQSLKPKLVTIVEEEADLTTTRNDFVKCFEECLRFYDLYFEMLDESFPPISNERLKLERERSRNIIKNLACHSEFEEEIWRPDKSSEWCKMLEKSFQPYHFSSEIVGDVKALLRRYKAVWNIVEIQRDHNGVGIHLKWKDEPLLWASAWRPKLSSAQDYHFQE